MRKHFLVGVFLAVFAAGIAAVVLLDARAPEPRSTPVAPLPGRPEIDLLAMVDPSRDAVKGTWTMENGRLVSDDGAASWLELPVLLPEEYSFTLEFVPRAEAGTVQLLLFRGGKPFVCRIATPDPGRVHTSTVEVRKDRVTVHLDNRQVADWKAEVGDRQLRHEGVPGLGISAGPVEFQKIRLFEVAGQGRRLWPPK